MISAKVYSANFGMYKSRSDDIVTFKVKVHLKVKSVMFE